MKILASYFYILLAYTVRIIIDTYYSNGLLQSCPDKCIHSIGYRKIRLIERPKVFSKDNANATMKVTTTSNVILNTKNEETIQNDKEFDPIIRYLQEPRSITVFLSDKMTSGFSNRLRSMRGLLLLAILNNASFCVKYDNYFAVMDDQLKVLTCKPNITGQYWNQPYIRNKLKNNPCDYRIDQNTEIRTNDDISNQLVKCSHFSTDIRRMNNWISTNNLRNYLSRFFFRPKPYIIQYGNNILSKMKGKKIGIQLRFGGTTASSHENYTFLNPNRMHTIVNRIKLVISQRKTAYSVFLSSDSPVASKLLSPLHIPILTAEKFQIGHTNKNNNSFYERAITDMYILSKCDILFHTYWSSYGQIAKDLSKSHQCYLLRN